MYFWTGRHLHIHTQGCPGCSSFWTGWPTASSSLPALFPPSFWSRHMYFWTKRQVHIHTQGLPDCSSASHPLDLTICISEQGDKSTFTHKDGLVVHCSGLDEQQLPHLSPLSFHPPSDLGTCTSEQGDRSTFIHKDPSSLWTRRRTAPSSLPTLFPPSLWSRHMYFWTGTGPHSYTRISRLFIFLERWGTASSSLSTPFPPSFWSRCMYFWTGRQVNIHTQGCPGCSLFWTGRATASWSRHMYFWTGRQVHIYTQGSQIVRPSGPGKEQLPHLFPFPFHPFSDLGTCTFKQGDRSKFIHKDPSSFWTRRGTASSSFSALFSPSFWSRHMYRETSPHSYTRITRLFIFLDQTRNSFLISPRSLSTLLVI